MELLREVPVTRVYFSIYPSCSLGFFFFTRIYFSSGKKGGLP